MEMDVIALIVLTCWAVEHNTFDYTESMYASINQMQFAIDTFWEQH